MLRSTSSLTYRLLARSMACLFLTVLAACASGTVSPLPASSPVPTFTPVSSQSPTLVTFTPSPSAPAPASPVPTLASPVPEPSSTPGPIATDTPLPSPTPAIFPTPNGTGLPQPAVGSAVIQVLIPGPLSKVVSPLVVSAYVVPGYNHFALLSLVGEDGSLLAEQKLELYTESRWGYFYWELPFTVSGVGELGRLTISTRDQ